jgi:hypothetical protein
VLHPSGLLSATVGEVRQLQHQLSSKSVRLGTKCLKHHEITPRLATHQATVPAKTAKLAPKLKCRYLTYAEIVSTNLRWKTAHLSVVYASSMR